VHPHQLASYLSALFLMFVLFTDHSESCDKWKWRCCSRLAGECNTRRYRIMTSETILNTLYDMTLVISRT